jgi:hypothetical protein
MKVARHMLAKTGGKFGKPQSTVFFLGFVFLLYWSWPAVSLVHAVTKHSFASALDAKTLEAVFKDIFDLYEPFRVRDGMLVVGDKGLRVCGRDKDQASS